MNEEARREVAAGLVARVRKNKAGTILSPASIAIRRSSIENAIVSPTRTEAHKHTNSLLLGVSEYPL
jgi:hypothetical protein